MASLGYVHVPTDCEFAMRKISLLLAAIVFAVSLLLSGCSSAEPTNKPDTSTAHPIIDGDLPHHLNEAVNLTPRQTVLFKNLGAEDLINTSLHGTGYTVVIEGNVPSGTNITAGGANVDIIVEGSLLDGSTITRDGGGGTIMVSGKIEDLANIYVKYDDVRVFKDGFIGTHDVTDRYARVAGEDFAG